MSIKKIMGVLTGLLLYGTAPAQTIGTPEEYAPYTGMSRWLITNTAEGGGLDVVLPGNGFKGG